MKVTAETITDEQLLQLMRDTEHDIGKQWPNPSAMDLRFAVAAAVYRNADQSDGDGAWTKWRAIAADAWNARYGDPDVR